MIVNLKELLADAKQKGYAVLATNSPFFHFAEIVVNAAIKTHILTVCFFTVVAIVFVIAVVTKITREKRTITAPDGAFI